MVKLCSQSLAALQAPGSPFGSAKPGNGRLVLVRVGVAEGFKEGTLLGTRNDPLSTLGRVQGQKAAELLMDIQVWPPLKSRQLAYDLCPTATLRLIVPVSADRCNLQQPCRARHRERKDNCRPAEPCWVPLSIGASAGILK